MGDLRSLEALTQAIVEGSAAAAKVLFLVRPNGTTRINTLAKSPNGAIVQGDVNDVSTLQLQKSQDFRIALDTITQVRDRLSFAFLLNSSVQRNAERVTAEEVRFMAQELESALGGVYSVLSQGVEALGRGQDLNKLSQFLQYLGPLGPEAIMQNLNLDDYIDRLGASLGIDTGGLIKTPEQKQMEAQQAQAQQQQMMEQQFQQGLVTSAVPNLTKGMADGANQNPEMVQELIQAVTQGQQQ